MIKSQSFPVDELLKQSKTQNLKRILEGKESKSWISKWFQIKWQTEKSK